MGDSAVNYVSLAPGGWRITGSRVSLDSIVHCYWEGLEPESIQEDFPSLSLEQIHGAIAFYLHHREEVDAHLASARERWEKLREKSELANAPLLARLRAARLPKPQDGKP